MYFSMEITNIIKVIKISISTLCFVTLLQLSCQQNFILNTNQPNANRNHNASNVGKNVKIEDSGENNQNQEITYRESCWSSREGALFIFGKTKLFHQIFKDTLPESYQKTWGKNETTRTYSYAYKELWRRENEKNPEFLVETNNNLKRIFYKEVYFFVV